MVFSSPKLDLAKSFFKMLLASLFVYKYLWIEPNECQKFTKSLFNSFQAEKRYCEGLDFQQERIFGNWSWIASIKNVKGAKILV